METDPNFIIIPPFRLTALLFLLACISITLTQRLHHGIIQYTAKEVLFDCWHDIEVKVSLVLLVLLVISEYIRIVFIWVSELVTCLSGCILTDQDILLEFLVKYLADCVPNGCSAKGYRSGGCWKVNEIIDGTRIGSALLWEFENNN
jgi:hypothetical protein